MKTKKTKILSVLSSSLVLALFLWLIPFKAEAKAFGSDCVTKTTVCKHYFLWINYDTDITDVNIDCSHLNPQ